MKRYLKLAAADLCIGKRVHAGRQSFLFKKVFMLEARTWCYSVGLLALSLGTGVLKPAPILLFRSIFPTSTKMYWFITAYIGVALLAPFLNQMLRLIDKKEHKTLIGILFVLFCVIQYIYPPADAFLINSGYSLIWFVFLYLVGSYIRLEEQEGRSPIRKCFGRYFVMVAIPFTMTILMNPIKDDYPMIGNYMRFFTDYSSPFVLLAAVGLFQCFASMKIKNQMTGKILTHLGPHTLGIYLIHEWPYLRTVLWKQIFNPCAYAQSPMLYPYLLLCVIAVFAAGVVSGLLVDFILRKFENAL